MRNKKLEVIRCPKCDREYLPAEIYIPKHFIGKPQHISRDYQGKILDFIGDSMDLKETYTCDSCNTTFRVSAKVSFTTDIKDSIDFGSDYSTTLSEQKLTLLED